MFKPDLLIAFVSPREDLHELILKRMNFEVYESCAEYCGIQSDPVKRF